MRFAQSPGVIKKFRRTPWRFQATVARPEPDEAEAFAREIIAAIPDFWQGEVVIDELVFGDSRLKGLFPSDHSMALERDACLTAASSTEAAELLTGAFGDGPDFAFIPMPKPFVIYADHHERITFLASSRSNLNCVLHPLMTMGCQLIPDWERTF